MQTIYYFTKQPTLRGGQLY